MGGIQSSAKEICQHKRFGLSDGTVSFSLLPCVVLGLLLTLQSKDGKGVGGAGCRKRRWGERSIALVGLVLTPASATI